MRRFWVLILLAALGAGHAQNAPQGRRVPDEKWLRTPHFLNRPQGGYVTKKATAIAIAKAILAEVYDDEKLFERNGPFDAKRFGDVWVVYSFVPDDPEIVGGGFAVQISASTGTIINTTLDQ
jgi:hypothetical protein